MATVSNENLNEICGVVKMTNWISVKDQLPEENDVVDIYIKDYDERWTDYKYLKDYKKDMVILGRSERTAKEIKKFGGANFRDFQYLRERLKMA